jgi:hypothetical protein
VIHGCGPQGRATLAGGGPMLDAIMVAIGLALFALSVAYAYACDRL